MSEAFEKFSRLLDSGVRNISQSFYDQYVEVNAKFRAKAGLKVTIVRESLGECCSWCSDLAGTYSYENAPDDIYARHRDCNCVVSTKTEKGTWQDAWSKKEYKTFRENRIAREQEIIEFHEKSNKIRKAMNQNTLVDNNYLNSAAYNNKFRALDNNRKVSRTLLQDSKSILKHRQGTEFEDLSFINSETGKSIINKSYDKIRTCKPNKEMKVMLAEQPEKTIIGLHNHPNSLPPSINDVMVSAERKYKYGVIACHDGTIYKYSTAEVFNSMNARIYLEQLGKDVYNYGIKSTEAKSTIRLLKDNGIIIEVF